MCENRRMIDSLRVEQTPENLESLDGFIDPEIRFVWHSFCRKKSRGSRVNMKLQQYRSFRHPWLEGWGTSLDVDIERVDGDGLDGPYGKTLRRLLEDTRGTKVCVDYESMIKHIERVKLMFASKEEVNECSSSSSDVVEYAELILVAKSSLSQLVLLYHELVEHTSKLYSCLEYWASMSKWRYIRINMMSSIVRTRRERVDAISSALRTYETMLGRLGSILENLDQIRRHLGGNGTSHPGLSTTSPAQLDHVLVQIVEKASCFVESALFSRETVGGEDGDRRVHDGDVEREGDKGTTHDSVHLKAIIKRHASTFLPSMSAFRNRLMRERSLDGIPSVWHRRWLEISLTCAFMTYGSYWLITRSRLCGSPVLEDAYARVYETARVFFYEHVTDPVRNLYNEVVLNKSIDVVDHAQVLDTQLSLDIMLRDFVIATRPGISETEVDFLLESGDALKMMSRTYETEMKKPLTNMVSGTLIQMLLIQVQFLKKELLQAMEKVDLLLKANNKNIEIMATMPAFVVATCTYLSCDIIYRKCLHLYSKNKMIREARFILIDVDHILNAGHSPERVERPNREMSLFLPSRRKGVAPPIRLDVSMATPERSPSHHRHSRQRTPTWDTRRSIESLNGDLIGNDLLSPNPSIGVPFSSFGTYVLNIERLLRLINRHIRYIPRSDLWRLRRDISELLRTDFSVRQKLRTLDRIERLPSFNP